MTRTEKQKSNYASTQATSLRTQDSRTNMAILHFIMTSPKWSITLFLFLAAKTFPIPTPRDAIQKPLERLRLAYALESSSYQQYARDVAISVKSLATVLRACRGRLVVSADGPLAQEALALAEPDRVVLAGALDNPLIEAQLDRGGRCVVASERAFSLRQGNRTLFSVANNNRGLEEDSLFVLALADGLGLAPDLIRNAWRRLETVVRVGAIHG